MTEYFDGKLYAQKKEQLLKERVSELISKGITPKLVSIIIGDDPGSILYQNLKKKAAERVGAKLEIIQLDSGIELKEILDTIQNLNSDPNVHGVMVQLPLPDKFTNEEKDEVINIILKVKDVDGLCVSSKYVAPVVTAIEDVMSLSEEFIHHNNYPYQIAVVGSEGFVGKKLMERLLTYNPRIYKPVGVGNHNNKFKEILLSSDIIISATGQPDLIEQDLIKNGVVLIDVGSPVGDIQKECYQKSSYVSPVPGGIGPATIVNLIGNLIISAESAINNKL